MVTTNRPEVLATNNAVIEEMARRIVERFAPDKIILFGSHVTGHARPESDVDLLVVMRKVGSKRDKATEIDLALVGLELPADIIVVRVDELERRRNQIGTVIHSALRDGKIIYERRT